MEHYKLNGLEKFQIVVGVVVSITTTLIGWQTYQLSLQSNKNNAYLKVIEQELAKNRFGWDA